MDSKSPISVTPADLQEKQRQFKREQSGADVGLRPSLPGATRQEQKIADTRKPNQRGK